MVKLLQLLLGLLQEVARLFSNKQLIDAGRAAQSNDDLKEVLANEERADRAVAVDDPDRDQRLRHRFDRSSGQ